jgi:hypothetical protein
MHRNQARFAKLALADQQQRGLPIDVGIIQSQGFTDPKAGGREQAE